jgi:hypothetical protein
MRSHVDVFAHDLHHLLIVGRGFRCALQARGRRSLSTTGDCALTFHSFLRYEFKDNRPAHFQDGTSEWNRSIEHQLRSTRNARNLSLVEQMHPLIFTIGVKDQW